MADQRTGTPDEALRDPRTSGARLAQIAYDHSELWPAVLAHPNCYDGLSEWIRAESTALGAAAEATAADTATATATAAAASATATGEPQPRKPAFERRTLAAIAIAAAVFVAAAVGTGAVWSATSSSRSAAAGQTNEPTGPNDDDGDQLAVGDVIDTVEDDADVDAGSGAASAPELTGDELIQRLPSAPTPVLCDHTPGRLVDGLLPVSDPRDGGAWLGYLTYDGQPHPSLSAADLTAVTDLDGDGAPDVAVIISCYMGGVSWPDHVVFYAPDGDGLRVLGGISLGDVSRFLKGNALAMVVDTPGAVRVTWAGQTEMMTSRTESSASFSWNGSEIVVTGLTEKETK